MPHRALPNEVEALLATLLAEAQPGEMQAGADRLESALAAAGEVTAGVLGELRSTIDMVRSGQPSDAVSALLAARFALVSGRA